jgi:hypothetical protein
LTEYQVNGRRSLERARFSVAHLRGAFDAASPAHPLLTEDNARQGFFEREQFEA